MRTNPNSITENLIKNAGINKGMRVLDVGCGNGETSKLLATAVGLSGEVIGIDRSQKSLTQAQEKLELEGFKNCRFIKADIAKIDQNIGTFDAIFGRRVLMYLANQEAALKTFHSLLKPGGIVAFQEIDATLTPGNLCSMPFHEKVHQWIWDTITAEGGNIHTGFLLPSLLSACHFQVQNVSAEAIIQGQSLHPPISNVLQAMLPRIVENGIATDDEIKIETLKKELLKERANSEVFISDLVFSVWAIKQ